MIFTCNFVFAIVLLLISIIMLNFWTQSLDYLQLEFLVHYQSPAVCSVRMTVGLVADLYRVMLMAELLRLSEIVVYFISEALILLSKAVYHLLCCCLKKVTSVSLFDLFVLVLLFFLPLKLSMAIYDGVWLQFTIMPKLRS